MRHQPDIGQRLERRHLLPIDLDRPKGVAEQMTDDAVQTRRRVLHHTFIAIDSHENKVRGGCDKKRNAPCAMRRNWQWPQFAIRNS